MQRHRIAARGPGIARQITLRICFKPIAASMIGSEKMTFSPVFHRAVLPQDDVGGMPRAIIASVITAHSESLAPGVHPAR